MTEHLCEILSCRRSVAGGAVSGGRSGRGRLCASCRATARGALLSLPRLYEECATVLTTDRQQSVRRVGSRTTGGAHRGIGLNERAVAARSDALRLLSSWAALIADEHHGPVPAERTTPALAGYLDGHLDWLFHHPAAAEFVQETTELGAELRAVLDLNPVRHWDLGPCATPGCSLVTRAVTRAGNRPEVRCDAGHAVRPERWLLMDRLPASAGAAGGELAS